MPKFAVYYVPQETDALYRLGSSVVGYDVRKREPAQTLEALRRIPAAGRNASTGCGGGTAVWAFWPCGPCPALRLSQFLRLWPSLSPFPYAARNGMPICFNSARPSASVRAVVVMEMFIPLVLSTLE